MSLPGASLKPLTPGDRRTFYLVSGFFALIAAVAIVKGFLAVTALPVLFAIILLCVFRLDIVALTAVVITPISLNLAHTSIGIGVSLGNP